MRDCRVHIHEWGIYGTQTHSQDSGNSGRGVERVQEPEFRSDCQQTVFRHKSGCCHEFTAVVAPAQHQDSLGSSLHSSLDGGWLGGHTQDQDSLHPSLYGGRLQEATVLTEELFSRWLLGEGESFFLHGVASCRLPMLQCMVQHPCSHRQHQLDTVSHNLKGKK